MDKKITVLYVFHEDNFKGSAMSFLNMAKEIESEINIICLLNKRNSPLADFIRERGYTCLSAPFVVWRIHFRNKNILYRITKFLAFFMANIWNCACALVLSIILLKYKIDIIHSNSSVVIMGGLLATILKVPHVWHIREFGEEDFGLKFIWGNRVSYDFMRRAGDKYIYISDAVSQKYRGHLIEEKGVVIHNCVDVVGKRNNRIKEKDIKLLISGFVSVGKGQRDACYAVNSIIDRGYENVFLHIAGDFNKEEKEFLNNYIATHHLEEHIFFCGRLSAAELLDLRCNSDVELMCSRCEAFGRVTIEAMRCGIPVIGTDTGGTPELIQEGVNGFLYKPGDYKNLADIIIQFITDPSLLNNMKNNAYSSVINEFLPSKYGKEIIDIYKGLLVDECQKTRN